MQSAVLLLLLAEMACGQLQLPELTNDLLPANMPQIRNLDVECAKTGMTVNIEFSTPFNGVIFSKGFYSNPACRYVTGRSPARQYRFTIPTSDCGTQAFSVRQSEGGSTVIQSTFVIQREEKYQELWDSSRTINCEWVDNEVRTVTSRPFSVDRLDSVELRFSAEEAVDVWMDLQVGRWPHSAAINSVVRIGESISVLVFATDANRDFELSVRDCYASSKPTIDDPFAINLQLTDTDGCVLKDKLIGPFFRSRSADASLHSMMAVAYMQAFKFPDSMDVYMICNVEVCKHNCRENVCQAVLDNPDFQIPSTPLYPPFASSSERSEIATTPQALHEVPPPRPVPLPPQPLPQQPTPPQPTPAASRFFEQTVQSQFFVNNPERNSPPDLTRNFVVPPGNGFFTTTQETPATTSRPRNPFVTPPIPSQQQRPPPPPRNGFQQQQRGQAPPPPPPPPQIRPRNQYQNHQGVPSEVSSPPKPVSGFQNNRQPFKLEVPVPVIVEGIPQNSQANSQIYFNQAAPRATPRSDYFEDGEPLAVFLVTPDPNQRPALPIQEQFLFRGRPKRTVNETGKDAGKVRVHRSIHVIAPDDLVTLNSTRNGLFSERYRDGSEVCMTSSVFAITVSLLVGGFLMASCATLVSCYRQRRNKAFVEVDTISQSNM